jgi:hypothetical protein
MPNGAIYILMQNERYVDLAVQSLASLKRAMPDLPITVFSQFPMSSPLLTRLFEYSQQATAFMTRPGLLGNHPMNVPCSSMQTLWSWTRSRNSLLC